MARAPNTATLGLLCWPHLANGCWNCKMAHGGRKRRGGVAHRWGRVCGHNSLASSPLRTVARVLLRARRLLDEGPCALCAAHSGPVRACYALLKQNSVALYNKITTGTAQVPVQVCCTPQVPRVPAYLHTVELLSSGLLWWRGTNCVLYNGQGLVRESLGCVVSPYVRYTSTSFERTMGVLSV